MIGVLQVCLSSRAFSICHRQGPFACCARLLTVKKGIVKGGSRRAQMVFACLPVCVSRRSFFVCRLSLVIIFVRCRLCRCEQFCVDADFRAWPTRASEVLLLCLFGLSCAPFAPLLPLPLLSSLSSLSSLFFILSASLLACDTDGHCGRLVRLPVSFRAHCGDPTSPVLSVTCD